MSRRTIAVFARAWNRFWFEPLAPTDLGIARLLFCTGLLLAYWRVDFGEWGTVDRRFWMPMPMLNSFRPRSGKLARLNR